MKELKLDLKGINAKIDRARESLRTLEADMSAFCEYQRRRQIFEIKQGWPRIVSENIPETPVSYQIRVGEIAYNLRSALDHLAWELVKYNGKRPSRRVAFPVLLTESQYDDWAKKNLKRIKLQHTKAIKLFQPFQKDGVVGKHLRMLNEICNIDKHRHLNSLNLHSASDIYLKEGTDSDLTCGIIGGTGLWDMLKGTEHEDKVVIEVINDICFVGKKLEAASVGYGSAIERAGIERPPVGQALWGCLTAVQFVVDKFNSGFMTGKWAWAMESPPSLR